MKNLRDDDYEFLGCLLEGVEGSLSEERRNSRPKNYTSKVLLLRRLSRRYRLPIQFVLNDPSSLELRLAEIAALHPKVQVEFKLLGINRIQGKNQNRKIKNILICLALLDIPEWLYFILLENFMKLIPKDRREGIVAELQFLSLIVQMEKEQRVILLKKIYSDNNLKGQFVSGYNLLVQNFAFNFFNTSEVKIPQRRRGYNDKGNVSLKSELERRKSMKEIAREIEERRLRILAKQMELFERNLDRILQIDTSTSRGEVKEIIRNQNKEINSAFFEIPEEEN